MEASEARAQTLQLLRCHGWNATSFQVLERDFRYFFVDDDACVAYVDTGRAWVAAGAPLAAQARVGEIAGAFVAAAAAAGRRASFFATEERFTSSSPLRSMLVGEQAVWDPARWDDVLRGSASLREQLRRARAKGVRVRALDLGDGSASAEPIRSAIAGLIERWLRGRELAPLGFLARVEPLALRPENRLLVAEQGETLVGLLSVAPVCGRRGWLLQNLLREPGAPNGTAEALIDHAMRSAAGEGHAFVTLGLAPLAGEVHLPLRLARRLGAPLYNFKGLRAFKAKLRPARWDRIYLSFPHDTGPTRAILDVLAAFAQGGLLRFGLRTLLRGPAVVVSALACLLIPWTALLAATDAAPWFPHPAIKWAWVAFDTLLAAGLFALRARWRDGLARLLTFAIGADAVLTALESASWNAARAVTPATKAILAVAMTAPALAYVVVSRATARRRTS